MSHLDKKIEWCINKAENEGRKHRGLKQVEPDIKLSGEFISKAEHNSSAMLYLVKGNFTDWAVSASFYARYHCLLAILAKLGYESRNQECTFAAVEYLIRSKKIDLDVSWLRKLASFDNNSVDGTLISLREEFQYGVKKAPDEKIIKSVVAETLEFIEVVKTPLKAD